MTSLGIIPARGGSKAIPRKNLAALAGRPLLAYTAEAALASARLTRLVVSTDDGEIAETARALGLEVPFVRPAAIARDETPMIDVLRHALAAVEAGADRRFAAVVLLQPTSPLRRTEDIDAVVDLLDRTGADAVVSVVPVPHAFSPVSVMTLDGDRLSPYLGGPPVTCRQDKPAFYARNGPAVLAVRRDVLVGEGTLYGRDCRAYVMRPEDSIDVDTPWDLELAAFAIARRRRTPAAAGS